MGRENKPNVDIPKSGRYREEYRRKNENCIFSSIPTFDSTEALFPEGNSLKQLPQY